MSWHQDLFGLAFDELPMAGTTLCAWRQDQLHAADCSVDDLHMGTDVVASAGLFRALKAEAASAGRPVRASVVPGPVHAEFGRNTLGAVEAEDGSLRYDLTVGGPAAGADPLALTHLLDVCGKSPQPGRMARPISAFIGDRFIWSLNHWYDLLVVNLLAVQTCCGRLDGNRVAPGAKIHPTAVVENSVVDRDAVIGPLAVVKNSQIGAGTTIDDQSNVRGSIIGPQSVVQAQGHVHGSIVGAETVISFHVAVRGSLLFGRSTISAPVVARSVIGPDTFLARDVTISASTLADQPIRVRVAGRSLCTGARLVGCVVGRGSRIGNGISIPAGYTVPAQLNLASRPLPRLDPDLKPPSAIILDGGRLRAMPAMKGTTMKGTTR